MEWKDDYTNVRMWEIWQEMQNNFNMSNEDIKNLPLECFWVVGIIQKIIRQHAVNWIEEKKGIHKVKPCQNAMFHGIECLESSDQFGFFKSEADVRPSSCTWIDKDKAEKIYQLFGGSQNV